MTTKNKAVVKSIKTQGNASAATAKTKPAVNVSGKTTAKTAARAPSKTVAKTSSAVSSDPVSETADQASTQVTTSISTKAVAMETIKKESVRDNVKSSAKKTSAPPKAPTSMSTEALGMKPYVLMDNEEYMNEAQQAHFRELLHAWRAALATKIDTAVSHLKDEPKHFADLNDRATQEEEFNLELKARDREADLVAKIDEALKRLQEGDYGYCGECGIEIGIRRLEARPTATLCIDCKTLAEMRERQVGGQ